MSSMSIVMIIIMMQSSKDRNSYPKKIEFSKDIKIEVIKRIKTTSKAYKRATKLGG